MHFLIEKIFYLFSIRCKWLKTYYSNCFGVINLNIFKVKVQSLYLCCIVNCNANRRLQVYYTEKKRWGLKRLQERLELEVI